MGNNPGMSWSATTLAESVDQLAGFAFKSKLYLEDGRGIRLLRGDNIAPGRVRWDGCREYPCDLLEGLDRYQLRDGDVVIAMDRPWIDAGLKVARVGEADLPAMLVQRVTRLRSRDGIDPGFIWACVRSPGFSSHLRAEITGTAVPHISGKQIGSFPMLLPPRPEQRAIASAIGALDAKIESNRRLADALKNLLMFAAPVDGDQSPLDAIAQFKNGGALTKHATGTGRPILRIKDLKSGVTSDTPRTEIEVRSDHEVSSGDLLFSWSGTLLTHRWSGPGSVLNQHVFRVDPVEGFPRWFVEAWIERHLSNFRAIAADKATTMGHIQRRHLTEAQVLVPERKTMLALRRLYDPLDDQRMTALREAGTLTAIRDALLPKLVSGQIRVPLSDDPEPQVGGTVEALSS